MYRYRLIDQDTGSDIGPLISGRLTFAVGEEISRNSRERYVVMGMVEPENENVRPYIVVRQTQAAFFVKGAEVDRRARLVVQATRARPQRSRLR